MFLFDFVGFSGATLTITGTSFGATPADNTVTIGGVDCPVTTASSTQLVCTLGAGTGTHDVEVNVAGVGLASGSHTFTYNTRITSIAPTSGSLAGLLIELALKFYRGYYTKIDIRLNLNKNFIKRVTYSLTTAIDEINTSYLLTGGTVCYLYSTGVKAL